MKKGFFASVFSRKANLIGTAAAGVHLLAAAITALYAAAPAPGQANTVWTYWALADFPVSLLSGLLGGSFLLVHVVLGTLWWYFVAVMVVSIHDQ